MKTFLVVLILLNSIMSLYYYFNNNMLTAIWHLGLVIWITVVYFNIKTKKGEK